MGDETIEDLLKGSGLKKHGYTLYAVSGSAYGYALTPSGNILFVWKGTGGLHWSFEYMPSFGTGSCCSCRACDGIYDQVPCEDTVDMSLPVVRLKEQEGLAFARFLGGFLVVVTCCMAPKALE